jgi:hypothetical protein
LQRPEILAVRCEAHAGGATLKVLATAALESVAADRAGPDVVVFLGAALPAAGLTLPQPVEPVRSLAFDTLEARLQLRIGMRPGTTVESRSDGSLLTLTFTSPGARKERSGEIEQLYSALYPGSAAAEETLAAPPLVGEEASADDPPRFLTLQPGLLVRFVDGSGAYLGTPTPVPARYLELQPSVNLSIVPAALDGKLSVLYEPRLRTSRSGLPVLDHNSHFLTASLDMPVSSTLRLALSDRFVSGAIETEVVDPGREYFFDVKPFKRNEASLSLRSDLPGRLDFALGASIAKETLERGSAYFGNDRRLAQASLDYELLPTKKLTLSYSFEQVPPPPTRPIAEMRAHWLSLAFDGDLTPLLHGTVSLGVRSEVHPRALPSADRYKGPVMSASLRRDLANGGSLTATGSRSTQLSAFEANAFYVSNAAGLTARTPSLLGVELLGTLSYHTTDYRVASSATGVPREDRIVSWMLGAGRTLTRWSSLRADLSRERRNSNVPGFSISTHAFVVQLGLFGSATLERATR